MCGSEEVIGVFFGVKEDGGVGGFFWRKMGELMGFFGVRLVNEEKVGWKEGGVCGWGGVGWWVVGVGG